ncbi:hypothetical protein [Amycolatopsis anabasis]|uniref:hypothetical protein n=1 Tax=Amycolatopsis anabasis TaxID=1840409 RepID=UPI00131A67B9|nr:hypothetical protein [Amycolatopsis anabasis]
MSLLDRWNEDIVIYPEETWTDSDGNMMTRPAAVGIPAKAMIRVAAQSGTSARRAEQDNEGFETEAVYVMRIPEWSYAETLGAQARIEWRGGYWAIMGDAMIYHGSRRTRHTQYTIRRS